MIDKYLLSVAEEDARIEEDFSFRVCELLSDEWNPEKFSNFTDAIADECLYKYKNNIEYAILHNDFTEYGRVIFKAVEEWCISRAEDQANFEFAKGLN
ncbi:hypothetical protein [Flavobacterium sp.]|jgi:hypothetical protein|uniref:hypothetical protein n=1 Tax=Flavobacterium sp. TaxID=239 RepID=UPI0037BFBCEB